MFSRHLECELALNQLHFFSQPKRVMTFFSFFLFVIIIIIIIFFWGGRGSGGSFLRVYVTFVFAVCLFVFVVVVFLSCLLRICLLICIFESFSIL